MDKFNNWSKEFGTWAYDVNSVLPNQDYDLTLLGLGIEDLLVEFASDNECPKQDFFLSCIYLIVGDAVMTNGQGNYTIEAVKQLLDKHSNNAILEI